MNKQTLIALAAFATALGCTAARADTMQRELNHHAAQEARIAADEARGTLNPASDAAVHKQAALVDRVEADALAANNAASLRQLGYAERDLDRTISNALQAKRLERMHASVADAREAQQQRWIAAEFRRGKLGADQAAALERDQAAIESTQAALDRRGHETVNQALRQQHRQDVQDWAILRHHGEA